jgi:hypothetical protein
MRLQNEAMRIVIDAVRSIRSKVLRAAIAPMAEGRFPALRIAMRLRSRNRDIDTDSLESRVRRFEFPAIRTRADRRLRIGR